MKEYTMTKKKRPHPTPITPDVRITIANGAPVPHFLRNLIVKEKGLPPAVLICAGQSCRARNRLHYVTTRGTRPSRRAGNGPYGRNSPWGPRTRSTCRRRG